MSVTAIVLMAIKALVAIGYLMVGAAVLSWADRRQGALVQDRIGPTRAVWFAPRWVLQGALFSGAIAAAAVVMIAVPLSGPGAAYGAAAMGFELGRMTFATELAILVVWFSLLGLSVHARRHGSDNELDSAVSRIDPRTFFFVGVALHIVGFPLMRLVPPAWLGAGAKAAEAVAGVSMLGAGLYAALKVPQGKVGIRLAGLIHPAADALKMLFKEDLRPKNADKLLFGLAPILAIVPALMTFAVIPFGSTMCFRDVNHDGVLGLADVLAPMASVGRSGICPAGALSVPLAVADLNVGLLYVFALTGLGVVAAAIAGWASDSKFALLGGMRAISQMLSYEVALGLSIVGMLLITSTVHMHKLVDWQGENAWGIFVQPVGFLLFLVAIVAETRRTPFDQPEGESEIVAGYIIEYSAMKFGLFYTAEYAEYAFSSALLVTLFFGGYHLPFVHADGIDLSIGDTTLFILPLGHLTVAALHVVAFFAKTIVLGWLLTFIRWTLPRFRYDQVMAIGWKKLLPWALVNVLVTAAIVLGVDGAGPAVGKAFRLLADLSQLVVGLGAAVALVVLVSWLIEPARHTRFLRSSSARFAAAQGGTKMDKLGA